MVLGPTTRMRWAYGASKAIDEFLALAYWREHRLPVVVGRFFNVVGPRQRGVTAWCCRDLWKPHVKNEPLGRSRRRPAGAVFCPRKRRDSMR